MNPDVGSWSAGSTLRDVLLESKVTSISSGLGDFILQGLQEGHGSKCGQNSRLLGFSGLDVAANTVPRGLYTNGAAQLVRQRSTGGFDLLVRRDERLIRLALRRTLHRAVLRAVSYRVQPVLRENIGRADPECRLSAKPQPPSPTMQQRLAAFVLVTILVDLASAQTGSWRDGSGKPIPETASMMTRNDFAGSLVVTTDENWQEKWATPPETRPRFNTAGTVPYGKKVFLLTLFANPGLDAAGNANLRCDFKLVSPTGKVSLAQDNLICYSGRIAGNPYNTYLSDPVIGLSGDPGDEPGTWSMEVKLRDQNRRVELPLRTSFELRRTR